MYFECFEISLLYLHQTYYNIVRGCEGVENIVSFFEKGAS